MREDADPAPALLGDLTVAVLAGGKSRRMGSDKAALRVAGESFLQRTVRVARDVCPRVVVVGRVESADALPADVPLLPDDAPGAGPLGGLVTALRHAPGPVLLLPCDMPHLSRAPLRWLVAEAAAASSEDGVAVRNGDRIEPLFSLYTARCLSEAERRLLSRDRSLVAFIQAGRFRVAAVPPEHAPALRNVNTPEDLADISG